MPNTKLYNMKGETVGEVTLSDAVFAAEVNKSALHSVVTAYLANQRQGTQSALTRSEVSGGGKKPWRQKGTGRARQGSTRAPQWTHGGIVFAPKPRDYGFKVNKKVKAAAVKSALSEKVNENSIYVIDEINVPEYKTKTVVGMLEALGVNGKAIIVTAAADKKVYVSAKNIEGVVTSTAGTLNVYELMNHAALVISKDAVAKLEEVYA